MLLLYFKRIRRVLRVEKRNVFGRYLSFKIQIFSSLKDKKTFRSNILIVKSFATFSNFWYINFTIEQKRCNICHIEYISHVNWINQHEEKGKK